MRFHCACRYTDTTLRCLILGTGCRPRWTAFHSVHSSFLLRLVGSVTSSGPARYKFQSRGPGRRMRARKQLGAQSTLRRCGTQLAALGLELGHGEFGEAPNLLGLALLLHATASATATATATAAAADAGTWVLLTLALLHLPVLEPAPCTCGLGIASGICTCTLTRSSHHHQ